MHRPALEGETGPREGAFTRLVRFLQLIGDLVRDAPANKRAVRRLSGRLNAVSRGERRRPVTFAQGHSRPVSLAERKRRLELLERGEQQDDIDW